MHEQTHLPVGGVAGHRTDDELAEARARYRSLLELGVSFPGVPEGTLPWLMAVEPFALGPELAERIQRLGGAVFAFVDAVQQLYAQGDPTVCAHLDPALPPDLRGRQLDRWIQTFRLDITLERGRPVLTEIEEVYGNAGKAYAMQTAYGVPYRELFGFFAAQQLSHILVDDSVRTYDSELRLLRLALERLHGQRVQVGFFSATDPGSVSAAWRFCYTADLAQYDEDLRRAFLDSPIRFVNPLFHGYGMKALLPLAWDADVADALGAAMGAEQLAVLRQGVARSELLHGHDDAQRLHARRRSLVVKVASSPRDPSATWGARGVHFGESSARRWGQVVDSVSAGHLPGRPEYPATFMAMALVDSDRFAVPYLHPDLDRIEVMQRARARIAPIFVRDQREGTVRLAAGHATFVNTSRKVHLGRHAVCAPLDWPRGR